MNIRFIKKRIVSHDQNDPSHHNFLFSVLFNNRYPIHPVIHVLIKDMHLMLLFQQSTGLQRMAYPNRKKQLLNCKKSLVVVIVSALAFIIILTALSFSVINDTENLGVGKLHLAKCFYDLFILGIIMSYDHKISVHDL